MQITETIIVDKNGAVSLPKWLYTRLLKNYGCRSKKKRQQRKIIKKEFTRLLLEGLDKYDRNVE
jgi:hypothetical protein